MGGKPPPMHTAVSKKSTMKLDSIFEYVKQQGFSIFLLCCAVYWCDKRLTQSDKRQEELNVYIRTEFKQAIDKNTIILEKVSQKLDNQK